MVVVADKNTFSEDQFGKKIDRCITDTLVKAGMLKKQMWRCQNETLTFVSWII